MKGTKEVGFVQKVLGKIAYIDGLPDVTMGELLVGERGERGYVGNLYVDRAEVFLVDGQTVELETFACIFDWFGKSYKTQIVANDGQYPLLGTMLLDGHHLDIDYEAKTVALT